MYFLRIDSGLNFVNNGPVRRALAVLAAVCFWLAFLFAPFLHVHEAKAHEHGSQGHHGHATIVHAHLALASLSHHDGASASGLTHEKHQARDLHFCAKTQDFVCWAVVLPEQQAFLDASPAATERMVRGESPRAHSPPALDSLSPRSPPA